MQECISIFRVRDVFIFIHDFLASNFVSKVLIQVYQYRNINR